MRFRHALGIAVTLLAACADSTSGSTADGAVADLSVQTDGGRPGRDTGRPTADGAAGDGGGSAIKTVFVIVLENHDWSQIKGSSSAPYINGTLLKIGAHAEQYRNPKGLHPSEPNYIWLEAGSNLGITDDDDPGEHHLSTTDHLVSQLDRASISWKVYAEGISGKNCPLTSDDEYGAKHVPQIFFDDVTDNNSSTSKRCIAHVRPFSELAGDLSGGTVARYNFLVPDLCHDMHGVIGLKCPPLLSNLIKIGDKWLAAQVPKILASSAFKAGGVLFIVADEGKGSSSDGPIPFLALGTHVKRGYGSIVSYDHSSLLRSIEQIFGVPYLRAARTAKPVSDLFVQFP